MFYDDDSFKEWDIILPGAIRHLCPISCWAHIISPQASVSALVDYLDAVPFTNLNRGSPHVSGVEFADDRVMERNYVPQHASSDFCESE